LQYPHDGMKFPWAGLSMQQPGLEIRILLFEELAELMLFLFTGTGIALVEVVLEDAVEL